MSRKGENIYKRKDGRWEGRYIKCRTDEGKAQYGYVYAGSYQQAKEKLQIAVATLMVQEKSADDSRECSLPFREAAQNWLLAICSKVKTSSSNKYENIITSYANPILGGIPLCEITQGTIESLSTELLLHGGVDKQGLTARTVSDVLSVIRRILRFASEQGYSVPCNPSNVRIKQQNSPMRVLSCSEQEQLCRYLINNLTMHNMGILLCLFTGIRVGELCALRWEDISIRERTIHVCQTLQRIQDKTSTEKKTKIIIAPPKSTCSNRFIPIPDQLLDLIIKYKAVCAGTGFFLSRSGHDFIEPRTMQNHFKRALKESGVPPANYHALRHTFATRCIEVGFDVKSLSEILGHANVNITMNRYVHPSMELKRQNMQRLSSLFAVK